MPIAEINVVAGRTPEQKKALVHAVNEGVLEGLRVGREALSVWLHEVPGEYVVCPEGKGVGWMTIRVTCFSGRTTEIKRELYQVLASKLREIGEDSVQCVITVVDNPMENWGIHGGKCAADVLPHAPGHQ